jgi:hypothetical protein
MVGRTPTENSARQPAKFQAESYPGTKALRDSKNQSVVAHEIVSVDDSVGFPTTWRSQREPH